MASFNLGSNVIFVAPFIWKRKIILFYKDTPQVLFITFIPPILTISVHTYLDESSSLLLLCKYA